MATSRGRTSASGTTEGIKIGCGVSLGMRIPYSERVGNELTFAIPRILCAWKEQQIVDAQVEELRREQNRHLLRPRSQTFAAFQRAHPWGPEYVHPRSLLDALAVEFRTPAADSSPAPEQRRP